jgi:hypothetical protein
MHTPESRGRRRLHRGAGFFPERCRRLRFPESRNRALQSLNLPGFAGPSRSDTFDLNYSKPRAFRSLLSRASRLRLRFLPALSRRERSFNGAMPPSVEMLSFHSTRARDRPRRANSAFGLVPNSGAPLIRALSQFGRPQFRRLVRR